MKDCRSQSPTFLWSWVMGSSPLWQVKDSETVWGSVGVMLEQLAAVIAMLPFQVVFGVFKAARLAQRGGCWL